MNNELKQAYQQVNQLTARAKKANMMTLKPTLEALADAQDRFNHLVMEALTNENRTA